MGVGILLSSSVLKSYVMSSCIKTDTRDFSTKTSTYVLVATHEEYNANVKMTPFNPKMKTTQFSNDGICADLKQDAVSTSVDLA